MKSETLLRENFNECHWDAFIHWRRRCIVNDGENELLESIVA